jgi:hypothetical protein
MFWLDMVVSGALIYVDGIEMGDMVSMLRRLHARHEVHRETLSVDNKGAAAPDSAKQYDTGRQRDTVYDAVEASWGAIIHNRGTQPYKLVEDS